MAARDDGDPILAQPPGRATSLPRDRFRGALLGLAVGDALGAPAEFLTAAQVRDRWGVLADMVGGGCHDVLPGEGSDATEMMLELAESLATRDEFDPEDVVARYRAWFAAGPRDVSLTTRTVMLVLAAGTPWDLASRRAYEVLGFPTAGNGSVMRCAPIALRYATDSEARRRVSLRESTITHYDFLAGWSCVALNELLAAALEPDDSRVAATLSNAVEAEAEEIHAAAFVLDSLGAAVWAVLHTPSFEGALVEIVNRGGDCDTVGAVAGALAGARYGASAIPTRWLEPLLVRDRVTALADALAERAGA